MPSPLATGARAPGLVLAVLALSAPPVFAAPPPSDRTFASVMRVEHQWLAALNRRDVTALARILGQEYIDSDFQGDVITRAQYLAYFARPAPHPAPRVQQSFEDMRVRFVANGDVAIVTGLLITRAAMTPGTRRSSTPVGGRHSRFTDVFVWREGRWQAVSGQETRFGAAAG